MKVAEIAPAISGGAAGLFGILQIVPPNLSKKAGNRRGGFRPFLWDQDNAGPSKILVRRSS